MDGPHQILSRPYAHLCTAVVLHLIDLPGLQHAAYRCRCTMAGHLDDLSEGMVG
jgi:hypothetical protein